MTAEGVVNRLDELLTTAELAKKLRLATKTVSNYKSQGIFVPEIVLGRRPLFDLDKCVEPYARFIRQKRKGQ